jgi:hypothetical protein
MLRSIGRTLKLRLGRRVCVCMRDMSLSDGLRDRIRPFVFGGIACWCDRSPVS